MKVEKYGMISFTRFLPGHNKLISKAFTGRYGAGNGVFEDGNGSTTFSKDVVEGILMKKIALFTVLLLCLLNPVLYRETIVKRSSFDNNGLKNPWGTVGFRFRTGNIARAVNRLGFIDLNNEDPLNSPGGDGMLSEHSVAIWKESTGSMVAWTIVPAGTGGTLVDGFRYGSIYGGAVTLEPNTNYVIAAESGGTSDN